MIFSFNHAEALETFILQIARKMNLAKQKICFIKQKTSNAYDLYVNNHKQKQTIKVKQHTS